MSKLAAAYSTRSDLRKVVSLVADRPWLASKPDELTDLAQLCDTKTELDLLYLLLRRFTFLDSYDVDVCLKLIRRQIVDVWNLTPNDTLIVSKNIEKQRVDSSVAINHFITARFANTPGWTGANFTRHVWSAIKNRAVNNLVLVDDFSGTGTSLADFHNWVDTAVRNGRHTPKNIYACFFACMNATTVAITPAAASRLYSVHWLQKGITDHHRGRSLAAKVKLMNDIENRIFGLRNEYRFGFQQSESLYATQNFSVPNNNFPAFWFRRHDEGQSRKPLFLRMRRGR